MKGMINTHKRSIQGSKDKKICNKSDRVRSVHLEARVASVFVDSWKNIVSDTIHIKINKINSKYRLTTTTSLMILISIGVIT